MTLAGCPVPRECPQHANETCSIEHTVQPSRRAGCTSWYSATAPSPTFAPETPSDLHTGIFPTTTCVVAAHARPHFPTSPFYSAAPDGSTRQAVAIGYRPNRLYQLSRSHFYGRAYLYNAMPVVGPYAGQERCSLAFCLGDPPAQTYAVAMCDSVGSMLGGASLSDGAKRHRLAGRSQQDEGQDVCKLVTRLLWPVRATRPTVHRVPSITVGAVDGLHSAAICLARGFSNLLQGYVRVHGATKLRETLWHLVLSKKHPQHLLSYRDLATESFAPDNINACCPLNLCCVCGSYGCAITRERLANPKRSPCTENTVMKPKLHGIAWMEPAAAATEFKFDNGVIQNHTLLYRLQPYYDH